jgi:hypothetical protein
MPAKVLENVSVLPVANQGSSVPVSKPAFSIAFGQRVCTGMTVLVDVVETVDVLGTTRLVRTVAVDVVTVKVDMVVVT